MIKAKGLVPDVNKVTGASTRKPKWISRAGRPEHPQRGRVAVEITTTPGTEDFLKSRAAKFEDLPGEASLPNGVITKANEPGSYGVGSGMLSDFNERVTAVKLL